MEETGQFDVDTLVVTRDEEGHLVLVLDGVEAKLPNAVAGATLTEDNRVAVYITANFHARTVDVDGLAAGS